MIQIAICNESEQERNAMREYLARYEAKYCLKFYVDEYKNGRGLLRVHGKPYDVLFIDVELEKEVGVAIVERLREINEEIILIIASSNAKHAIDACNMNAEGFLLKPSSYDAIEDILLKSLCKMRSEKGKMVIHFDGNTNIVQMESIVYVEYYNHKITFHLMNGEKLYERGSLKKFLDEYRGRYFIPINKNCVINILWIESYDKKSVRLKGVCNEIEISRPKWKVFEQNYLEFCKEILIPPKAPSIN